MYLGQPQNKETNKNRTTQKPADIIK